MPKKKKNEIDLDVPLEQGIEGMKSLFKAVSSALPSKQKRLAKAEKKYRLLKARVGAMKKEKEIKEKIKSLEEEERKLEEAEK